MNALLPPDLFLPLVAEYLPDMLWAKDLEGKYLFVNKAICEGLLMAQNLEEPIGKNDIFFALRERAKHPENPKWHTFGELCFNSDEVVIQELKSMRFEEYGNVKGKLLYLEVHKAPLFDADGILIGTIGTGRDITKQKLLEKELTQVNQTFKLLLNSTLEGLFISDENRRCIHANTPIETILGYRPSEVIGKHIFDFVAEESRALIQQKIALTDAAPYEAKLNHKDGRIIDALIRGKELELFGQKVRLSAVVDISERARANERIAYLAYTDQLTSLPNRHQMNEDIEEHYPHACVLFNVDAFKEVNDLFGVEAGDQVLKEIAQWFNKNDLRPYRVGGDEFALLYFDPLDFESLYAEVVQLMSLFDVQTFHLADEIVGVHLSVGIAYGGNKLLTHADIALHRAKERREMIAIYDEHENVEQKYHNNIIMATTIRKALLNQRITCCYQPIADFTTGNIVKYEALVRAFTKSGEMIPPLDFLPVAKKTKVYPLITREVVHQACHLFANRAEEFSINLSVIDIEDTQTVETILNVLEQTQTASRVVFEILESEGIDNYTEVIRFIHQVKALGAKIAIDDFGTGHSNFEHLLKLNVDYIKIDGFLIQGMLKNPNYKIIVETIVDFSRKIGAKTVAEYVSDETIYRALLGMGVDYAQGYYIGKPQPLNHAQC